MVHDHTKDHHRRHGERQLYDLIMQKGRKGFDAAERLLNNLEEIGGSVSDEQRKKFVSYRNFYSDTPLHIALGKNAPLSLIKKIVEIGGEDVLFHYNDEC